jgi:hypothetical protein
MKKTILVLLLSISLQAEGLFSQGQKNFGITAGTSTGYGNTYTVVGASANYFVIDNLSVGAEYRGWFGESPTINEINIPITYYVPTNSTYQPYGGVTYKHTFIEEPYEDYNIYGVRAGVAMSLGPNSFMTIGWVQEFFDKTIDGDDSRGYPEISAGFSF